MPIEAVVGINWGDEGKGRIVDFMAENADAVIRYQGGNNAGHTVINQFGTFKLHLLPSGVFQPHVQNILGTGMVIDLEALNKEIEEIQSKTGLPLNLHISDQATIVFPFHRILDTEEESRLGDKLFGSTRRGIAPAYGDRYMKKALKIGDLLNMEYARERTHDLVEWANCQLKGIYRHSGVSVEEILSWLDKYSKPIIPLIKNTKLYLENMLKENKTLLFEAQLGALRDIDYGIYPYTSSSSVLSSNIMLGGSMFGHFPNRVVGVMKSFSTCVGEGPFVTELGQEESTYLRTKGNEYGAATGRPRRIGHFDAVASRYGVSLQAATEIALTKLDTLSGVDNLKICVAYQIDGATVSEFPHTSLLSKAVPIYIEMPGWDEDISHIRSFEKLPNAAREYVLKIETLMNIPIRMVSVGPEREQMIIRNL